jgi:hypothetical protein
MQVNTQDTNVQDKNARDKKLRDKPDTDFGPPPRRRPADKSRINIYEPWDLAYWSGKLRVTPERLRAAVMVVGSATVAVRACLDRL